MANVAIVTANLGGVDLAYPQAEQDIDVDWLYLSDQEATVADPKWRIVHQSPGRADPRLAAKIPKMLPWVDLPGYGHYIWIDASMEVTSSSFAREAIEDLDAAPIAAWRHPRRDCAYDEAAASVGAESQGKYDRESIQDQMAYYAVRGLPRHGGLYACGTLAWNACHPDAAAIGGTWYNENRLWTVQDQISLPFVQYRLGVEIATFRHEQMDGWNPVNPWLCIHRHLR